MGRWIFWLGLVAAVLVSSCVKTKIASTGKDTGAHRYISEFPEKHASDEIGKITGSVKKLYSVSSYTTYQFKREAKITGYSIHMGTCQKSAWGVITTNETVFGTATIIGYENSRVALLTCAHVVNSPDTLVSYFESTDEDPSQYVQSFSIKEKQENWVKGLSSCGPFTVLASDIPNDIAIIGKNCESLADTVNPFTNPAGRARELAWGSFVYVFGFPLGNLVITRGIVSLAGKRPMGEFSIDALLNKGYSGGIIVALRHDAPDFELVGMVKTVNSTHEDFLKPASGQQRTPDWLPYRGDVYVGATDHIEYGLNAVVPFEAILGFYQKNRPRLILDGYNLDRFFLPVKP
ncbi:MAG: serine protease [Bacteroidetes bacterium]|nr:serine protease [Bacteroidota bacterium]